jgi:hypothetical protein
MQNSDPFAARDERPDDSVPPRGGRPGDSAPAPDDADGVLAAFEDALAGGSDHDRLLLQWTKRYPAHAADLAFAAASFPDRSALEAEGGEDIPVSLIETLVAEAAIPAARAAPEAIIPAARPEDIAARPLETVSLEEQARRSGLRFPEDLADLLRVSARFVERLQRREIDPGTIPAPFAVRMAGVLQVPLAECVRMLRGAPRVNVVLGEERPPYGTRISFEQALRESEAPDDRDRWLTAAGQGLPLAEWDDPVS